MIKPNKKRLDPIAFSYLRFSTAKQLEGDSQNRQIQQADAWAEKNGIEIVKRMGDLGLSAWSGKHVSQGELGSFLKMCQSKDFRKICQVRDVYLIVESLDRLSRAKIMTAVNQLHSIIDAGVIVVTIQDGQVFTPESMNNPGSLIIAVTIMSRANEESERKSGRILSAYQQKRQDAIDGKLYSRQLPAWLTLEDPKAKPGDPAKFKERPEVVTIIRRIFRDVASGITPGVIARQFNKDGVPTLGDAKKSRKKTSGIWYESVIKRLLHHPSVGGTLRFGDRFDSEQEIVDVENYYPRIIDVKLQARAIRFLTAHGSNRGKQSTANWFLHLFRKIAFDWKTKEAIYLSRWSNKKGNDHMPGWAYLPRSVRMGKRKGKSWNGKDFENIFFATIRLALEAEGSTMQDEADLAIAEIELDKIQQTIKKIRDLFLANDDDDLDLSIFTSKLKKLQDQEKALLNDREMIKIKIQAGAGTTKINPMDEDRERLARVIRSNVERIDIDCDKQRFKVKLLNGIKYEVNTTPTGLVEVVSDDFKTDAFDLHDVKVHRPKSSKIV